MTARLLAARNNRSLWANEQEIVVPEGGLPTVPWSLVVPEQEGVYEILLSANRRTLQERLGLRPSVEERRIQLVVVSPDRLPPPLATAAWEQLLEIDPANPTWPQRLGTLPLVPGLRRGPLGSGTLELLKRPEQPLVQLGPGAREPDIAWEAYPLAVSRVGQPHLVEVEYASDVPQALGLSIVEPNAAGAVLPIGLDSGLFVSPDSNDGPPTLRKHRLIFWPKTSSPLLLVTNRRPGTRGTYGKIRLLGPRGSAFALGRGEAGISRLPRAFAQDEPLAGRTLWGYFDRPLFPENFSANQGVDLWNAASGRTLDDWNTFQEGGTRLVEYLNHIGYSGVILSVLADGSTIYPSELLEPTPRYDDGMYFATGQDPVRKDGLELLLRLFDREQLQLVPALQFASPLPQLEALRREGTGEGLELVHANGLTWLATHEPREGTAPYYNPLDERVQDAMFAVVDELVRRYGNHPSLAGLSLQLTADGYAQLPGLDWGYDERTVDQFARETQVELGPPGREHLAERVAMLRQKHLPQWIEWRAQNLVAFYDRLQFRLTASRPDARLYLAGADLFERPELLRALQPALPTQAQPEELMRGMGIDPQLYRTRPNVVLLRTQRISPGSDSTEQAAHLAVNQSSELDQACAHRTAPGSLFFHEPQEAHLASFEAKSPFRATHMRLVSQLTPAGDRNRRRFIHALASLDAQVMCDGGWLLPMGEEDSLREFVEIYRRLPARPFTTVTGPSQPVIVRTCSTETATYIYLVNDSPWKTKVSLAVTGPEARFQTLGTRRYAPLSVSDGGKFWSVEVGPYDVVAGRFDKPQVRIDQPRVELDEQAVAMVDARIDELWSRVTSLRTPRAAAALTNADFELAPTPDGRVQQWLLGVRPEALARLDPSERHGGQQSLRLSAGEAGADLTSQPVASPQTGRLSVSVWLRVADENRQPPLRLGVQSYGASQPYARYAVLGLSAREPIRKGWTRYVFQVHDLPGESIQQVVVRFELSGPGEVWIDDVQLFDLDFADGERLELVKIMEVAKHDREKGQWCDCLRVLDGYWPRYLTAHVPINPEALARQPARVPSTPPTDEDKKPGMLDRLRKSMPDLWWR
jgi:hypothetical protein